MKRILSAVLILVLALSFVLPALAAAKTIRVNAADWPITEDGWYSSMEEVALYLDAYGRLPGNFLTKREAEALGWNSREGNLGEVAPGMSIGGDHFGNYEGNVPDQKGRRWTECDIHFDGGYRGGERIVFSNDGLIYYCDDHYATFRKVEIVRDAKPAAESADALDESAAYLTRDDVAAYLHQFGHLPDNYLTKTAAKKLGWKSGKDNLGAVAPGCAIGGSDFSNREGALPEAKGRTWKECDVNTVNGARGAERLVFSNDGLIYYTSDDYQSFTRLY